MCLAIKQMREESEAIGMEKGKAIGMEKGKAIGMEKGKAIGLAKGEAVGRLIKLFELVEEGLLTLTQAAANAKLTEDQFKAEMAKAGF